MARISKKEVMLPHPVYHRIKAMIYFDKTSAVFHPNQNFQTQQTICFYTRVLSVRGTWMRGYVLMRTSKVVFKRWCSTEARRFAPLRCIHPIWLSIGARGRELIFTPSSVYLCSGGHSYFNISERLRGTTFIHVAA